MTTREQRAEYIVSVTLDRIQKGQSNEDSLAELKLKWPEDGDLRAEYEFVRQIAAHANASGGTDIFGCGSFGAVAVGSFYPAKMAARLG